MKNRIGVTLKTTLLWWMAALLHAGGTSGLGQPTLNIERGGILNWPHSNEEFVVLAADSPGGPWVLWPRPVYQNGGSSWAQVPMLGRGQFYKLVQGHHFHDDFTGSNAPWTPAFSDPDESSKWTLSYDGALRIQYEPGATTTQGNMALLSPESGRLYGDPTLALDILDWDETSSRQTIGVVARAGLDGTYIGRINFNDPDFGGRASLAISLTSPLTRIPLDVDPNKDYRLVFTLSGTNLKLSLFALDDPTRAIATISTTSSARSAPGSVGIWVNANWGESRMETIVDDFVVTERRP